MGQDPFPTRTRVKMRFDSSGKVGEVRAISKDGGKHRYVQWDGIDQGEMIREVDLVLAHGQPAYTGSNPERQSVGKSGHCDLCAAMGHVYAHPDLGCGDVGCNAHHEEEPYGEGSVMHAQQDEPFEPGSWVTIVAQVMDQEGTHPEDLRVRVDSHNASPEATFVVRRDWAAPSRPPASWPQCSRLFEVRIMSQDALVRCGKPTEHEGNHSNGAYAWPEDKTVGYIEDRS